MVVFDRKGKFVRSWGKEFKGGAHGLHIRSEGRDEFLYLCDTKRARGREDDAEGRDGVDARVSEGVGQVSAMSADGKPDQLLADQHRHRAERRRLRRRRLRVELHQPVHEQGPATSGPSAAKGRSAGQLDCPHGLIVDRARSHADADGRGPRQQPPPGVLARRRRTCASSTGTQHPCHFSEHKGDMVVPDLWARVTLHRSQNNVIAQLGDAGAESWKAIRRRPARRVPGRQVRLPARRLLRSRRQHLRRRMGRSGKGQ